MNSPFLEGYYLTAIAGKSKEQVKFDRIFNCAYLSFRQILEIYKEQDANSVLFEFDNGDNTGRWVHDFIPCVTIALYDICAYYLAHDSIVPDGVSWYAHLYAEFYRKVLGGSWDNLDRFRTSKLYNAIIAHYIKES